MRRALEGGAPAAATASAAASAGRQSAGASEGDRDTLPPAAMVVRATTMEHDELVREMALVERLTTQERLKLARRRRKDQLRLCLARERDGTAGKRRKSEENWSQRRRNRSDRIHFVDGVVLLEAASRNDVEEGECSDRLEGGWCFVLGFCECLHWSGVKMHMLRCLLWHCLVICCILSFFFAAALLVEYRGKNQHLATASHTNQCPVTSVSYLFVCVFFVSLYLCVIFVFSTVCSLIL